MYPCLIAAKKREKKALKPHHLITLRELLSLDRNWRDLALLNLAVDTCLRGSDLIKLRQDQTFDEHGNVRT